MKQNLILALLVTTVYSTTAQTDSVPSAKSTAPSLATINTIGGSTIKGWLYTTDNDNVYLLPTGKKVTNSNNSSAIRQHNGNYIIDATQINTISLKKKNSGLKGALIGMGAGIVIGAIAGFASGDDPVTPYTGNAFEDVFVSVGNAFAMTAGQKAVTMGLVGGLTGALIGGITGALLRKQFVIGGKKDNYHNAQAELNKKAMVKF